MANYTKLASLGHVRVCENCGALVIDEAMHTKFHEALGQIAQQAYQAATFTNRLK